MANTIVSCEWLLENLNNKNLVILDASPQTNKSGLQAETDNVFIPNARHFNLAKDFSDVNAEFPNTFPSEHQFNTNSQKLGVNQDSIIVVYDNLGIYSSPRVWWMFQSMGHENVFVLNGGLPEWIKKDYPVNNSLHETFEKGSFQGKLDTSVIKDYTFMQSNASTCTSQVIDARSKGRFEGTAPEPREGLKSGAIPYSINIPFQEVIKGGCLKSKEELKEIFKKVISNKQPKIFSCGSGLTACIILLAAKHIGISDLHIYDGSWTEWATKQGQLK